jgi:hypothetical protein
MGNDMNKMLNT